MNLAVGARMTVLRACWIAAIAFLFLICISCGDTFRPVAVPLPPPPPDPGSFHFAIAVSGNGPSDPGTSTRIDVSGDTNVGNAKAGLGPVHAALLASAGRVYVANNLEDTVTSYAPSSPATVITTSLGTGSAPVFVGTSENASVYVANSGTSTVAVINTATNVVTNTLTVGANPVALVETPDARKVYVASQGSNTVTSINTIDKSVNATLAAGTSPIWVAARSDSARVYVLNSGSGTVSVIDTSTDTVLGNVFSVGVGANYMTYDPRLNRLYVTNPVNNTVSVLDISVDPPSAVTNPLFVVPVSASPVSIAVLPDGSAAYVASFLQVPPCTPNPGDLRPCISSMVTTINTSDGSLRDTVPLQATVSIKSASQSGSNTTYKYSVISGPPIQVGMTVVIAGMADAGNNGTFAVTQGLVGSFTVVNAAGVSASGQSGTAINVVEVDTVNPTGCGTARFRLSVAASATSPRIYVANCDAGEVAILRTVAETSPNGTQYAADTIVLDLPAPASVFPAPLPTTQPPPQNPVFILAEP